MCLCMTYDTVKQTRTIPYLRRIQVWAATLIFFHAIALLQERETLQSLSLRILYYTEKTAKHKSLLLFVQV